MADTGLLISHLSDGSLFNVAVIMLWSSAVTASLLLATWLHGCAASSGDSAACRAALRAGRMACRSLSMATAMALGTLWRQSDTLWATSLICSSSKGNAVERRLLGK